MMDHADVREQLELAAVEPGGLDRIMAGDTTEAAALAGHLAGCDDCMEELGRLRRSSHAIRETIATQPSPELRARTLALATAVGRDRSVVAHAASPAGLPAAGPDVEPFATSITPKPRRRRARLGWIAAAAAALLLAVGLTWTAATLVHNAENREQTRDIAALGQLSAWQLRIDARDDAQRVLLASTTGSPAGDREAVGSLAFSPGSHEMVVSATGLEPPDSGREYRCWVTLGGQRERLGKMYFAGDVALWVGRVDALAQVEDGATFGVSLADTGSQGLGGDPVLAGTL